MLRNHEKLEEAHSGRKPGIVRLRAVIFELMDKKIDIALLTGLEWRDSKVFAFVLEKGESLQATIRGSSFKPDHVEAVRSSTLPGTDSHETDFDVVLAFNKHLLNSCNLRSTTRLLVTVATLAQIEQKSHKLPLLQSWLIHSILLEALPLSFRRVETICFKEEWRMEVTQFMDSFCEVATKVHQDYKQSFNVDESDIHLVDMVDGRLFFHTLEKIMAHGYGWVGPDIILALNEFLDSNITVESWNDKSRFGYSKPAQSDTKVRSHFELAAFSHPAFDQHLAPVRIVTKSSPSLKDADEGKPATDLNHWHNSRKPIVPKKKHIGIEVLTPWQARSRDRFMAEMTRYAASLTNTSGKCLEPQLIICSTEAVHPLKDRSNAKETSLVGGKTSSNKHQKGKKNIKSQLVAYNNDKAETEERSARKAWDTIKNGLDSIQDPYSRLSRIDIYVLDSARKTDGSTKLEILIYRLNVLRDIWRSLCQTGRKSTNLHVAALVDVGAHELTRTQVPLPEFAQQFLRSTIEEMGLSKLKPAGTRERSYQIDMEPVRFRLAHEGPYMERGMGSEEDPRTEFKPDAWQRDVLDALDRHSSLLILAPTSSGKTFISFYAMEKILRASDEDVIVYVAPTKALVNQIAAEVHGRFRKNYKSAGKSLYAIHTRDYRINNPTRAQILVTVPHILQIMLLSPANKDWVPRIKTIVFDEVHCISQSEDGLVWEQLLLMAPCQIIALSATVGNPESFAAWLKSTHSSSGREFKVIEHQHRFSDLRKYIHLPSKHHTFNELPNQSGIVSLGLDGIAGLNRFHPVSCLITPSRGIPPDLALESSDCLTLYETMLEYATDMYPVPPKLSPQSFGQKDDITKSDIIQWGMELMEHIRYLMKHADSPFKNVIKALSNHLNDGEETSQEALSAPTKSVDGSPEIPLNSREPAMTEDNNSQELLSTTLPLLCKLREAGGLPAILFNYNRGLCEEIANYLLNELMTAEKRFKDNDERFKAKLAAYKRYRVVQVAEKRSKDKKTPNISAKKGIGEADKQSQEDDIARDTRFDKFDPEAPLNAFSFADLKKGDGSELDNTVAKLRWADIDEKLIHAFQRGIGVHHAGMNLRYRQAVEMWFRRGFLTVVIATGTLSLGINMPCKTVVFAGDSVFLTALNFRQASGRAGRRGFDLLGNVVFHQVSSAKASRLLSSRLPDLNGHFPMTTVFILRVLSLLHGTKNAPYAVDMVNSLLSQPRLYLGGESFRHQVLHHVRFSIEYLRSQDMIKVDGEPINFAHCVSHLYFEEKGAFSFHALLRGGYFQELARTFRHDRKETLKKLMNVLAHLFGRHPFRLVDKESEKDMIKKSPSVVFLPRLPSQARDILEAHNRETLQVYTAYVRTFIEQHCRDADDVLPFSKTKISPTMTLAGFQSVSLSEQALLRSPFVALSGHNDDFESIADLCSTVRDGVFLEEAVIPHLDLDDDAAQPLNAYLYDFFQHGGVGPLEKANRIRKGDIWFVLRNFSLILATIIAALEEYMGLKDGDDIPGLGDEMTEEDDSTEPYRNGQKPETDVEVKSAGGSGRAARGNHDGGQTTLNASMAYATGRSAGSKPKVMDNWDDDGDEEPSASVGQDDSKWDDVEAASGYENGSRSNGEGNESEQMALPLVLHMFKELRDEFDGKFKKMWA